MSYCVNCGVELDQTASACPLCQTPVVNPRQGVDTTSPKPFPTERSEVAPASKREVALLLSVMLASVAVCCGVLNLFVRGDRLWSLYLIGGAAMLWLWLVPPLIKRNLPLCARLVLDVGAVAVYVWLISIDLDGGHWYWGLALPIILLLGAVLLALGLLLQKGRRSILTSVTLVIAGIGVLVVGVEAFVDRYLHQAWRPGWSLVVLTVCLALIIPLVVVRRVPALREEARRRFHL